VSQALPFVSVIVPTYDRPRQLARCLRSLSSLDYPSDRFEVIVVDDGSESPPEDIVADAPGQLDTTLLSPPHAGPASARNYGAAHARGEYLAFTDDDCVPTPSWLRAIAVRFAATPGDAIGGRTLNGLPKNLYATASQALTDYLYTYNSAANAQAPFFTSNNLAVPGGRFREIGGFDTSFPLSAGEDRELCDRWRQHGYGITYAPEAVVYHTHDLTLRSFCRQHFNYGRAARSFQKARARRGQPAVRREPARFYLNLLLHPYSQGEWVRSLPLAALLALSQMAYAAGFLWARGAGDRLVTRSRSPTS